MLQPYVGIEMRTSLLSIVNTITVVIRTHSCPAKEHATLLYTITLEFCVRFCDFCSIRNRNE